MKKKGSAILSCVVFVFVALFSKAQSNPSIIAPTFASSFKQIRTRRQSDRKPISDEKNNSRFE